VPGAYAYLPMPASKEDEEGDVTGGSHLTLMATVELYPINVKEDVDEDSSIARKLLRSFARGDQSFQSLRRRDVWCVASCVKRYRMCCWDRAESYRGLLVVGVARYCKLKEITTIAKMLEPMLVI
jgi:hypothetical protein